MNKKEFRAKAEKAREILKEKLTIKTIKVIHREPYAYIYQLDSIYNGLTEDERTFLKTWFKRPKKNKEK